MELSTGFVCVPEVNPLYKKLSLRSGISFLDWKIG
jgi:hypothetical protein